MCVGGTYTSHGTAAIVVNISYHVNAKLSPKKIKLLDDSYGNASLFLA